MYLVSAFCAITISYILLRDLDGPVAETSVMFAFMVLGGIVGSYVFGAAWQDIRFMQKNGGHGHRYKDEGR